MTGFESFGRAIDPARMDKKIRKHIALATRRNGLLMRRAILQKIKRGGFKSNAPLTTDIKKSTKPLVDKGDFFTSITVKQTTWASTFVGILATSGKYNIAKLLHEGGWIDVTDKMRAMFFNLWLASEGRLSPSELTGRARELWERKPGGWFPLRAETTKIRIPGRPFIKDAIMDDAVKQTIMRNWESALQAALREASQEPDTR